MLNQIKEIFAEVLEIDPNLVTESSTIENLDGWDSMKHLELVLAIESKFQINFQPHEVILLNSVERIINGICNKKK
jgi:acyl carrier protein